MGVLGAATALCIINGISINPIDPVLLHYFVHNCDINSIYPALLAEWHPELKKTISDWINLGPDGDLGPFQAHFATHNDIQVACLRDRDQASHDALAVEMLHRGVIGAQPSSHPEIEAFKDGFRLPCRNGFDFCDVSCFFFCALHLILIQSKIIGH